MPVLAAGQPLPPQPGVPTSRRSEIGEDPPGCHYLLECEPTRAEAERPAEQREGFCPLVQRLCSWGGFAWGNQQAGCRGPIWVTWHFLWHCQAGWHHAFPPPQGSDYCFTQQFRKCRARLISPDATEESEPEGGRWPGWALAGIHLSHLQNDLPKVQECRAPLFLQCRSCVNHRVPEISMFYVINEVKLKYAWFRGGLGGGGDKYQ